jgi:hypothetical protein
VLLLSVAFAAAAWAEGFTDIDKENGFLGIGFGTRIEDATNLEPKSQSKDGRYVCKVRKAPLPEFPGEAKIQVFFYFFDGICFGAQLVGHQGGDVALRDWMKARYGPGFNSGAHRNFSPSMNWFGYRVSASATDNSIGIYNRGWERVVRVWRLEDRRSRWGIFPQGY